MEKESWQKLLRKARAYVGLSSQWWWWWNDNVDRRWTNGTRGKTDWPLNISRSLADTRSWMYKSG
jgi:hypothetical protein